MPTVQLTGDLGLDTSVTPAPFSALLSYLKQLQAMHLTNGDFSKAAGLTLDQPALLTVSSGLSFDKAVTAGPAGAPISVSAGAHGSLELIKRTPAVSSLQDVLADDVEIADGTCYVGLGVQASVGASTGAVEGSLQFGVNPGASLDLHNYRKFPLQHDITLLDAVKATVAAFVIPASADDLASLPEDCVATVTGTGSLTFSGTANLLAVTNPLASVQLPGPLPAPSVTAGGSVDVGAALTLSCTFQVCARKVAPGHVQLGWYREKATDFAVTATASEGVAVGFGTTDVFSDLIRAISSNATADLDELQKAGLPPGQIQAIQSAVAAAVNRKLELAVSAEIGSTNSASGMFVFDIDLAALTTDSRKAIDKALRGDLSGLHAASLPGISPVQSVWEKAKSSRIRLDVNLLGIINIGMISSLTTSGSVMVEPGTGALVISDSSSAERIRSTSSNFGANAEKLRRVMAEAFLLTATYQGLQGQVGGPSLKCSHDFFELKNNTSLDDMVDELRIGVALGLLTAQDAAPPAGIKDFGRTVVHASTEYDNGVARTLFLGSDGTPFTPEYYENAGRAAIQLLVGPNDLDAIRRRPAIDDGLWARMKDLGQPGIAGLFPGTPAPFLGAITADYSVIMWWADAMAGASQRLAAIGNWFAGHPTVSQDDPHFQNLRQDLAAHLKQVVAKTKEQFGEPWGLIAMDQASGRRAGANILIAGPKVVRMKQRALAAAAGSTKLTD